MSWLLVIFHMYLFSTGVMFGAAAVSETNETWWRYMALLVLAAAWPVLLPLHLIRNYRNTP